MRDAIKTNSVSFVDTWCFDADVIRSIFMENKT